MISEEDAGLCSFIKTILRCQAISMECSLQEKQKWKGKNSCSLSLYRPGYIFQVIHKYPQQCSSLTQKAAPLP